jgi:hypothetical protein
MTTLWAMLDSAFYLALVVNGWVRIDDYVDGHGLVAMVPIGVELKNRTLLDPRQS